MTRAPRPAARLAGLGISPIRKLADGAPSDAIPLGLGEPTWELHACAREALARTSGVLGYGPQAGDPALRAALAELYGTGIDGVLVTVGTQEGLFDACQAYLDVGDQALIPDPGFPGYGGVVRMAGAEPVTYALDAADRFRLDAGAFARALDGAPRAKLAIVAHPGNPTGGGASREALARVASLCEERGVLLVSDEVYRDLWFREPVVGLRDVSREGLVLSSASKGLGAPGLRVGWVVGEPERVAPLRVVHGYAVTSTALPSQRAVVAMLARRDEVLAASRRELRARFDALAAAMHSEFGERIEPPAGGFYHFLRLPEATWADPFAHAMELRDEHRVVIVPGLAFGENGRRHARLSFAARPDDVAEGVRRLARAWGRLS